MRSLHIVALLVALCLVSLAGTASADAVNRPTWTAGDYWTYETNTTLIEGLDLIGTSTVSIAGTIPVSIGGGTVEAFRSVLSGSGEATGYVNTSSGNFTIRGIWTVTGEERFEPANLHPVYNLLDLSANGTYGPPGSLIRLPFFLRVQNTTTYAVVSDGWAYPFVPGATGNVTTAYNFTQDVYSSFTGHLNATGTGEANFTYSLAAPVSVTTPAGTFDAYPEREEMPDGTWRVALLSPRAGNAVQTKTYDSSGNLTSVETLTAYRYQAAEPPTLLGLSTTEWIITLVVVAVAATVLVILLVRRRRKRSTSAPGGPQEEATSGPRGP